MLSRGRQVIVSNAQLRPGNRYCSEEADSFITPVLERFNQLLFR
ncbi:valyl-tRNA synthetase, partial [Streptococcus pneumoniae GA47778]